MHTLARDGRPIVGGPQMVLHISSAPVRVAGRHDAAELGKNLLHRLAHHVCQNIQAACSSASRVV